MRELAQAVSGCWSLYRNRVVESWSYVWLRQYWAECAMAVRESAVCVVLWRGIEEWSTVKCFWTFMNAESPQVRLWYLDEIAVLWRGRAAWPWHPSVSNLVASLLSCLQCCWGCIGVSVEVNRRVSWNSSCLCREMAFANTVECSWEISLQASSLSSCCMHCTRGCTLVSGAYCVMDIVDVYANCL